MTSICSSGLRSTAKRLSASRDFALRNVCLPANEPVTDAYFAISQVHSLSLDSLEDKASGFTYATLMADTPASIALKNKDRTLAVAEAALDMADIHRTKDQTSYTPVTMVSGFATVLQCNTNTLNYFIAKFLFDINADSTLDWPNFAAYIRNVSDLLTGEEAKNWLKKHQSSHHEIQLAYYIIHNLNSILARLGGALDDQECLMYAKKNEWAQVSVSAHYAAERIYYAMKETIENALVQAIEAPTSPLWNSSSEKATKDLKDRILLNAKWNTGAATIGVPLPPPKHLLGVRGRPRPPPNLKPPSASSPTTPTSTALVRTEKPVSSSARTPPQMVSSSPRTSMPSAPALVLASARTTTGMVPNAHMALAATVSTPTPRIFLRTKANSFGIS